MPLDEEEQEQEQEQEQELFFKEEEEYLRDTNKDDDEEKKKKKKTTKSGKSVVKKGSASRLPWMHVDDLWLFGGATGSGDLMKGDRWKEMIRERDYSLTEKGDFYIQDLSCWAEQSKQY